MKALKIAAGLLFDDTRLVVILLLFLVISGILCSLSLAAAGTASIWLGVLLSLYVSIRHQLRKKLDRKK